jgi:hypothetical protein
VIGARVGQRSLSVTADTYTHVLLDDRELKHAALAAGLAANRDGSDIHAQGRTRPGHAATGRVGRAT